MTNDARVALGIYYVEGHSRRPVNGLDCISYEANSFKDAERQAGKDFWCCITLIRHHPIESGTRAPKEVSDDESGA